MSDITPERVRELLDAATPGPWTYFEDRPRFIYTAEPIKTDEADWGPDGHTAMSLGTDTDPRAWSYANVRLIAAVPDIAKAYLAAEAKIAAALALADQWDAIDGVDQRAATLHAVADDLRTVLGKSGQP